MSTLATLPIAPIATTDFGVAAVVPSGFEESFAAKRLAKAPRRAVGERAEEKVRKMEERAYSAERRRELEVVFVLRKILGHGDEFAANLVPGIQLDLQFGVGRFDGCIFLHQVLGMGGKCECQRRGEAEKSSLI